MVSRFYKIVCNKCGAERIVFSNSTRPIYCKCGKQLVQNTGGRIKILNAKIVETYD